MRDSDSAVFLRVWQDRKLVVAKSPVMMVTHFDMYVDNLEDYGFQERLRHVSLIREGAKCYMIMCRAANVDALPRTIAHFNDKELFIGGEVLDVDNDAWIKGPSSRTCS